MEPTVLAGTNPNSSRVCGHPVQTDKGTDKDGQMLMKLFKTIMLLHCTFGHTGGRDRREGKRTYNGAVPLLCTFDPFTFALVCSRSRGICRPQRHASSEKEEGFVYASVLRLLRAGHKWVLEVFLRRRKPGQTGGVCKTVL